MKKRKCLVILIALMLVVSAGAYAGMFDKIMDFCKAYIYCNGVEIPS